MPSLAKRIVETSPERGLVPRGSPHKRMQSMQSPSVRDLSLMIEGSPRRDSVSTISRSPEKLCRPISRPHTPYGGQENDREIPVDRENRENERPNTPTPMPLGHNPLVRPSARRLPTSILGENTPPQSATMQALQNMAPGLSREPPVLESPLATVTNNSTALVKSVPSIDNISHQIITLTSIATGLQKEMSLLSRRSRDNATDLASLKEATHARDEDIRKSLRELATTVEPGRLGRDPYGAGLFIDSKPHLGSDNGRPTSSKSARPFSLPRIPSPNSFAASIDRESTMSTPSLIASDSPATLALLEKIIREMGTKDGQDNIVGRLGDLVQMLGGLASSIKVEELIAQLKSTSQELSLVPVAPGGQGGGGGGNGRPRSLTVGDPDDDERGLREIDWNSRSNNSNSNSGPVTQRVKALINQNENRRSPAPAPAPRSDDVLNEDVIKIIRGVKDSVAQGGGLTAEVKALVRELRGEVLGMGREIGRRLEEVNASATNKTDPATKAQVDAIIEDALEQMKNHMNQLLREHRRASAASTKSVVDYQEIYKAMSTALKDSEAAKEPTPDLNREDVVQAVKEAWENYKPDIVVEQVGLERDEVLACLKEGLQEYAPKDDTPQGVTREQVFEAVMEGLQHYSPPQVETPAGISRDEILEAVRECLEEFEFPVAPSALNNELTRDDMLHAVKEGLQDFEFPSEKAVALHSGTVDNDEIVGKLHDIMGLMRDEFKAVSDEAKQNVAANGRDTEQVLDATKDGFEQLRAHLEDYMERVNNPPAQEDHTEDLILSLDGFRADLTELITNSSDASKSMLREEIESLRDTVNSSLVPHAPPPVDNREIIEALREGLERVRTELLRPHAGTTDILDALSEGFGDLRMSIEKANNKPADLTANDEILDALKSGLDSVRTDIDALRESQNNEKALTTMSAIANDAVVPAISAMPTDLVKQDDIKNLEVMLTQLRIKVEALDAAPAPAPIPAPIPVPETNADSLSKEDLAEMEEMLRNLQESIAGMGKGERSVHPDSPITGNPEDAACKEDVQAIETILRNTKSRLDDLMDGEQAVRKDHVDAIEALVLETKDSLNTLTSQLESVSKKEDIVAVESLVTQITVAFDEMKERAEKSLDDPERVTKTDVEAIGAVCLDLKSVVDDTLKSDLAGLASKEELKENLRGLEDGVKEAREVLDKQVEATEKAFEERQAEIVGVGERVTEVRSFLEEFRGMVKEKLESDTSGLEALGVTLVGLGETLNQSTVSQDVKEMFELMKSEFEESKSGFIGAKLDADEKLQSATDTLGSRIDERITSLIAKYEEFQVVVEERAKAGEARDTEMEAAVVGSKAVSDELKLLVDTLGSTVTDSMQKMEEASKTVFGRVEELFTKSEENHTDQKAEHLMTREKVEAAIGVVEGLQGHVVEYQPQILEAVKEVLVLVAQHYEDSKSNTTELQRRIEDMSEKEIVLQRSIEDVKNKPDPPLLPAPEKYDDTEMHAKLDTLVSHTRTADEAYAQLGTLDKVHAQVVRTAADISSFLDVQTKRIESDHEEHEKTLQETRAALDETKISLAVAQAEKEHVEGNVIALRSEEEQLRDSISALKSEHEFLSKQKIRLTADSSSLETAIQIRREELHAMEARAEGLERRILQGILDHSRALLMTKNGNKGREAMNRKRVPGARSSLAPNDANTSRPMTPQRKAVNLAVGGGRASLVPPNAAGNTTRRILSLSQIGGNSLTGGMKRSQSVRNPAGAGAVAGGLRKGSWGGNAPRRVGELVEDKENRPMEADELQAESDEHSQALMELKPAIGHDNDEDEDDAATETPAGDDEEDGEGSDAGTLRRSSLGTTVVTEAEGETETEGETEGEYSCDEDAQSEWTESAAGTESGLGTESEVSTAASGAGEAVLLEA